MDIANGSGTELNTTQGSLKLRITDQDVKNAQERCRKYADSLKTFAERLKVNDEYYRQRYENIMDRDKQELLPRRASAYLLNSIFNKVADMMDNIPAPNVLPREKSDETTASLLSKVVPVVMERNHFKKTYYRAALEKINNGVAIYGVFWNPTAEGIGEVEVSNIDPLNLLWEPGIEDIQEAKEVFLLKDMDNETLVSMYPQLKGKLSGRDLSVERQYTKEDETEDASHSTVYDWYYKRTVPIEVEGQMFPKTIVCYAKFCAGVLLYSSENTDPASGWYDDGKFPLVFDVLYPIKGTPYGYGFIDMMREPQEYIDRLDFAMLQNVIANARPRYLSKEAGGINEEEFTDFTKHIVHYTGNSDDVKPMEVSQLPAIYAKILADKKEELKENTGNRDFSQGTTSGGVTAASAIAALQEASSKTSRTINLVSYEAFEEVIRMVIDRMQQFYTIPRVYRVTSDNGMSYESIGAENLREGAVENLGTLTGGRKPVFDIEVTAEKSSPYSKVATNEFAKELFAMGVFNPQLADQAVPAVRMMDFDKKEEVLDTITKNQQLYVQNQQMMQLLQGIAPIVAETTGDTQLLEAFGSDTEVSMLGEVKKTDKTSQAAKAREAAASRAEPGGAD